MKKYNMEITAEETFASNNLFSSLAKHGIFSVHTKRRKHSLCVYQHLQNQNVIYVIMIV